MVDSRADVERVTTRPALACNKNPGFSHILNFEQQIREINHAINSNVSAMISTTSQEARVGRENNMQGLDMAMLEKKESNHASGPNTTAHVQSSKAGHQGIFLKPM